MSAGCEYGVTRTGVSRTADSHSTAGIAATGMTAQETKLDSIANNLANANTTGFKKQEAEFEDLLYQNLRTPTANAAGGTAPAGAQV